MDTRNVDFRTGAREDERRRRDEVQIITLQQQVDELRNALREHGGRQQRLEEQIRQSEAQLGQVRLELNEARQEVSRLVQTRQLEDQRIRQLLSDLQTRTEEPLRQLRAVQAQVNELLDHIRHQREHAGHEDRQIEELRVQVESYRADIVRSLDLARQAREALDTILQTQASVGREIHKLGDQGRLVEQETRRRIAELEQQLGNLGSHIEGVGSYRPVLEEAIRQIREDMEGHQPQLDALGQKDEQLRYQLERAQSQTEERATLMRERLEDIRTQLTSQISDMATADDEAIQGLHERIGEWEAAHRELVARLSNFSVRLSSLQQEDERLEELIRRTEDRHVLSRLEEAQQAWEALMERRQKESEE